MKRAAFITILIAALLVPIAMSTNAAADGPYWPSSWAHAYVHFDGKDVYVTYVESAGCRDQKIELSLVRAWNLDPQGTRALATATAVNLLGNNGFEMVGEGHAYCHFGREAIHFKRARL